MNYMLEMLFGKEKANQLLNKWKNMSSEQRQTELNKIKGIPQDELKNYLINNFGFDPKWLENFGNIKNKALENNDRKFNY